MTGIDGTAQHLISYYDIFSFFFVREGGQAKDFWFFEQQLTDFDIWILLFIFAFWKTIAFFHVKRPVITHWWRYVEARLIAFVCLLTNNNQLKSADFLICFDGFWCTMIQQYFFNSRSQKIFPPAKCLQKSKTSFFLFDGAKKVHNSIDSLIMFDDEGNVQYYR